MQRYNSSVIGKKSTVSTSSAKGIFSINNLADEQRNDNWPTVPLPTFNMEILLVGGGGSGGKAAFTDYAAGGGGGGGVILSGTYTYTQGTQLDIVVGAGGAAITGGNTVRSDGNNGNASSIQVNGAGSTYISLARGGGGGGGGAQNANVVGLDGANGGGGYSAGGTDDPGMGYGVNGTEVTGYHGEGTIGDFAGGAGGGAGGNASSGTGGIGTNAYSTWATATSTGDSGYYGGGGAPTGIRMEVVFLVALVVVVMVHLLQLMFGQVKMVQLIRAAAALAVGVVMELDRRSRRIWLSYHPILRCCKKFRRE